jgi:4-azaleucine resistance transporter AzlC
MSSSLLSSMQRTPAYREFLNGIRDQIPILLGVAPFGLIFGALAVASGIPPLEAQGFSLFVFAGSAQFIAVGLISNGVQPLVIVLTILVVNLRHLLYSASLAPYIQRLPSRWKFALAWLLTDEAFAVSTIRYRQNDSHHTHWYMLGTGLTLWGVWQLSTAIGIVIGARLPESWSLDFALPLVFITLLIPTLTNRAAWASSIAAGTISVALAGLPYKLGLLLAAILGIITGLIAEMLPSVEREETV